MSGIITAQHYSLWRHEPGNFGSTRELCTPIDGGGRSYTLLGSAGKYGVFPFIAQRPCVVKSVSFSGNQVGAGGLMDFALYTPDGSVQIWSVQDQSVNSQAGLTTVAIPDVAVPAQFLFAVNLVDVGTNNSYICWTKGANLVGWPRDGASWFPGFVDDFSMILGDAGTGIRLPANLDSVYTQDYLDIPLPWLEISYA